MPARVLGKGIRGEVYQDGPNVNHGLHWCSSARTWNARQPTQLGFRWLAGCAAAPCSKHWYVVNT